MKDKRITVRLPGEWLDRLRTLARSNSYHEQKDSSVAHLIREAILKIYPMKEEVSCSQKKQ